MAKRTRMAYRPARLSAGAALRAVLEPGAAPSVTSRAILKPSSPWTIRVTSSANRF